VTAEIAIINKGAVTLATDSAVTLTVRGSEKIYNSADKLFEATDGDPIGIMVYNNLEYMGISLEVAIKKFRSKSGRFETVAHAANSFFEFLLEDLAPDEALQRQHAGAIVHPILLEIRRNFERAAAREFEEKRDRRKVEFSLLFTRTVQRRSPSFRGSQLQTASTWFQKRIWRISTPKHSARSLPRYSKTFPSTRHREPCSVGCRFWRCTGE